MTDSTFPVAYLNGRFLPVESAAVPIHDLGLTQGVILSERLRTVRHRPYLVREHLSRLERSLSAVGLSPDIVSPLEKVIDELARRNGRLIDEHQDLSIAVFVTPGSSLADSGESEEQGSPTVCISSTLLPLAKYAIAHREGLHLVTPVVQQISPRSIDPHIKTRNRLHWYLAERAAERKAPNAAALLLDELGFVTETSTGNLFIVREGRLETPREEWTLQGISQQKVLELALQSGLEVVRSDLTPEDVANAAEAFLTSSTYCILPVSQINHQPIGDSVPGPITKQLSAAWSEEMGLDFVQQALRAGT